MPCICSETVKCMQHTNLDAYILRAALADKEEEEVRIGLDYYLTERNDL